MTRLTSIEKGGYYAFPDDHLSAMASLFKATPDGGKLLDPCAGEGRALKHLAEAWGMTPYANELDEGRAAQCRSLFGLNRTVCGDLNTLRTSAAAYPVIWCNPPYTEELSGDEKRREFAMLKKTWQWLQPDGYMLWVIYAHHFSQTAALWLAKRSAQVDVWRLPGLHLKTYIQIVVVAQQGTPANGWETAALDLSRRTQAGDILELAAQPTPRYIIPKQRPLRTFIFSPQNLTPAVMAEALTVQGAHLSHAFAMQINPEPPPAAIRPIVKPRGGQLGLVLAAGLFNGMVLSDENQQHIALRSIVEPVEEKIETEGDPDAHDGFPAREVYRTVPTTTTTLLMEDGTTTTIAGDAELLKFIRQHKASLLAYIDKHFQPLYTFEQPPTLQKVLAYPKRGKLYSTQKHVIAATVKAFETRKGVILSGEPGTGKTIMGATVAAALLPQMKPGQVVVIMAPPHLVNKWEREVQEAAPKTFVKIITNLDETRQFMDAAAKKDNQTLKVAILSRERAKLGEGWTPAVHWRTVNRFRRDGDGQRVMVTRKLPYCPTCSQPLTTDKNEWVDVKWLERMPRYCKHCKGALWQMQRTFSKAKPGQPFKNPRVPLAEHLAKRYGERIYLYVADELHELKGDTDQGDALMHLANAATKTLGMTGTLYGGMASSLHRIEFLFNPRVRLKYPLSNINEWVKAMGVLEKVIEYNPETDSSGRYSGKRKREQAPREAPGCSPSLVAEIIDHTIFVGLNDMGKVMPAYEEIPVTLAPDADMAEAYEEAQEKLKDYLRGCLLEGDNTALGMYLQTLLSWPSAPYRNEQCIHRKRIDDDKVEEYLVHTIPALDGERLFPKEQWLLDLVRAELAEQRGVAVFCRQTGTRDIQPHIEQLLKQHVPGAKPFILQGTVAADKREEVLKRATNSGVNVLICNPRLVQTGLDLLEFPSIVFFEIDYSLYVTGQASRRAWRLIQTRPCRTYFPYYEGLMEDRAISLVGQKQAAAALLYGEESGGLSSLTSGTGSLLKQLAKEIGETASPASDLKALFARNVEADYTQSAWYTVEIPQAPAEPEPIVAKPPTPAPTPSKVKPTPIFGERQSAAKPKQPAVAASGQIALF